MSKSDSDFGESLEGFLMDEEAQKKLCTLYENLKRSELDVMRFARRKVKLRNRVIKLNRKYSRVIEGWSRYVGNIARRQYLRIHSIEESNKSNEKTDILKNNPFFQEYIEGETFFSRLMNYERARKIFSKARLEIAMALYQIKSRFLKRIVI